MANCKYYLNKQRESKDGYFPVYSLTTFNNKKIRRNTGVKVKAKHWNEAKQRIKPNNANEPYNNYIEYNSLLNDIESKTKKILDHALLNGITLTENYILDILENRHIIEPHTISFFEAFQKFIESQRPIKAIRTIMNYNTCLNFLKAFEQHSKQQITFQNLNSNFFEGFRHYAYEEREADMADNYFAKLVANLKTFLNWATEKEFNKDSHYKKFKAPEKETDVICLFKDELFKLYNYQFESKRLEQVRDVYCFGCFTGLRFSDIVDLKREFIQKDYINKNIIKNKGAAHKIPLNVFAKAILEKYQDYPYGPLPIISNQKFNDYIKECCKLAGIDTPTTITKYAGNKCIRITAPKYELITAHTARKTFATNSLILGMKEMVVRNITGHKKDVHFRKYIKVADNFQKEEMDNTWNKIIIIDGEKSKTDN